MSESVKAHASGRSTAGDRRSIAIAKRPSTRTEFLLDLQRTAGNAAVSGWLATVQRKTKKPKPKPTLPVTIDEKGRIHSADAAAALIGFKDASGTAFVQKPKDAATGTFSEADGGQIALSRLHRAEITAGADGAVTVTFASDVVDALLTEADVGIVVDAGGKPVKPASMPAPLSGKMVADARLEGSAGTVWVLMTFPDQTLQWVETQHAMSEYTSAEAEVRAEAENLPAAKKAEFANVLRYVSVVEVIEGHFGSTSTKKDNTASLGIFQWGMKKKQSADTESLGPFFSTLKARATASLGKKEDKRTDEDKLYINAWKQCTDAGLDVTGTGSAMQITLNGKAAKGEDVESTMAGPMGKDSLRTYQLIAALDWINAMKANIVMPGDRGKKYVGNGYSPYGDKQVTLKGPTRSLVVAMPDAHLTIGDACGGEEALAVLTDVLPNRPAYVRTSVWRAEVDGDVEAQIGALLASIEAAQPAPAPAPAGKKKTKAKPPAALTEATVVDKADYAKIQQLLWPSTAVDDYTLITRFEATALEFYKAEKLEKRGSRRMATAHLPAW